MQHSTRTLEQEGALLVLDLIEYPSGAIKTVFGQILVDLTRKTRRGVGDGTKPDGLTC
jgi:hypothetical protein